MIKIKPSLIFFILSLLILLTYFIVKYENKFSKNSQIIINNKTINLEIADTDAKREKGLSFHKSLSDEEGMLFVFDKPGRYGFWMKDMTFDLDFIWIKDERIVDLTENVSHNNQRRIYQPKTLVDKMLEVNAGFARRNEIKIGDIVNVKFKSQSEK